MATYYKAAAQSVGKRILKIGHIWRSYEQQSIGNVLTRSNNCPFWCRVSTWT